MQRVATLGARSVTLQVGETPYQSIPQNRDPDRGAAPPIIRRWRRAVTRHEDFRTRRHRGNRGRTMPDPRHTIAPDWPPPIGAYDYVLTLSGPELAWEFLRRNPDYQREAWQHRADQIKPRLLPSGQLLWRIRAPQRKAQRWGLCPFRRPDIAGTGRPCLLDRQGRCGNARRHIPPMDPRKDC